MANSSRIQLVEVNKQKGFTLIELLVVLAIIGILSGTGLVAYNSYTSTAKETVTKSNHTKVVNSMENEFAKCKLDKNSTKLLTNTEAGMYNPHKEFGASTRKMTIGQKNI